MKLTLPTHSIRSCSQGRRCPRLPPRLIEPGFGNTLASLLALRVAKDVAGDRAVFSLQPLGNSLLVFEDAPQVGGEGKQVLIGRRASGFVHVVNG